MLPYKAMCRHWPTLKNNFSSPVSGQDPAIFVCSAGRRSAMPAQLHFFHPLQQEVRLILRLDWSRHFYLHNPGLVQQVPVAVMESYTVVVQYRSCPHLTKIREG